MRSLVVGLLTAAAAFGLSPPPAHAAGFSISPIRLDLSATARTAALTVRNDEREALVQAEVMLWEQVDGQDRLTPTRDLLVSPAVFTLPPNGSQLVRVALRNPPADTTRELSYRLILQDVPQAARPDFSGLQVALRLSVPVFIAVAGTSGPALEWSAAASGQGLVLTAQNTGDMHARIHGFSVTPADGGEALVQPAASYILPGQTRHWTLGQNIGDTASPGSWRRLRLKVTTEDGESETELDAATE
jgi:fimbrial chaperone protein